MFLLHADEKFYTSRCEKISDDGGCTVSSRSAPKVPPAATVIHTSNMTLLSDGFNAYSVVLPDGCRVNIEKDGTIHVTEKDSAPRKVRYGAEATKNIIK